MTLEEPQTVRACDYVFNKDILVVKGALDFGARLIEVAGHYGKWSRASTVPRGSPNALVYGAGRTNDSLVISGRHYPPFTEFEGLLQQVLHGCAHVYRALNTNLHATRNTGFELLRYEVGQQFEEHVDVIAGHRTWGARQLSIVAFLNDDFEGGELRFSRQDLTIQPVAGDVILFPSAFTHPHAVLPVARGARYAVVTWLI